MAISVGMVTFDTLHPRELAAWWAAQTGGHLMCEPNDEFVWISPGPDGGPSLGFQGVPDPTPGKNKLHLDTGPGGGDAAAEEARLIAAGATFVAHHDEHPGIEFTVLADPDGNQFCLSYSH
ncbi:MAG: VOC family protein [Bifidobacteriaceae bacterium]|jgi:hypothetical protein|nr:VOC family protein [Bifidobacteriaceae bacterium]